MVFLGAVVVLVVKSFSMACTGAVMSGNAANGHVGQSSNNNTPSQRNSRPGDLPGHFPWPIQVPTRTPYSANLHAYLAYYHFLTTHANPRRAIANATQRAISRGPNPLPAATNIIRHHPNHHTPKGSRNDPLARFPRIFLPLVAVLRNTGAARRTKKTQDGEKSMQG